MKKIPCRDPYNGVIELLPPPPNQWKRISLEGESLQLRAYWESHLTQDSEESSEPMERRQGLSSSALWEQMYREGYM